MDRKTKIKQLLSSMSNNAIVKTLPKMDSGISIFLKKHRDNKERFKKEIQFTVK